MAKAFKLAADIPGLISLFGNTLYSDFGAVLRELVQNGHDAIILRSDKDPTECRIDVSYSRFHSLLTVFDDGCGMSLEDLSNCLNNFGSSYKQELIQQRRAERGHLKYAELIGQYGVGFLSALAASESVEVYTCSTSACATWKYRHGDARATIEEIAREAYTAALRNNRLENASLGTLVVCRLRQEVVEDHRIDEDSVKRQLKKYTALLPAQVYFEGDWVNYNSILWSDSEDAQATDWTNAIRELHHVEPQFVTPLNDAPKEYDAAGVLYIRPRKAYRVKPAVDVYIKRMYVSSECPTVVPLWAGFCGGIINSNSLARLLSGEGVKADQLTRRFRAYLEERIISIIKRISENAPLYREILGPYDDLIKHSAIDSDNLLRLVWNRIPIPLATGEPITMEEYLADMHSQIGENDEEVIYQYSNLVEKPQAMIVSETTQIPIFDVTEGKNRAFVGAIGRLKNIQICSLTDVARTHFKKPESASAFEKLRTDCMRIHVNAMIRRFLPNYVPAMLVGRTKAETVLSRDLTLDRNFDFYLNAENPLIKSLCDSEVSSVREGILQGLYNFAVVPAFPNLKPTQIRTVYESIQGVMTDLVGLSANAIAQYDHALGALGDSASQAMDGKLNRGNFAIAFHDIIGSTWLLSNLGAEAAKLFREYCSEVNRLALDHGGHFDKFTGDGAMLLFADLKMQDHPVRRAVEFSRDLLNSTRRVFQKIESREAMSALDPPLTFSGSRVAIAFGKCHLGWFGGGLSVVGRPVVACARVISNEGFFTGPDTIALTGQAADAGGYGRTEVTVLDKAFVAKGLPGPLQVCRLP